MARAKVYRTLPPIEEAMKHFAGFPEGKSRQQAIMETIRTAAKRLRRSKPTPFYSMREAARFFNAPLGTMSLVYQALEKEGILNRLRSSQTVLTGKTLIPRDVIRGVVGLPIWLRSMIMLPYTPLFVMEVEERLRKAGYVADIIFHYLKNEEADPTFATRLLRHRLDAVVLQSPIVGSIQNILSLRERGVRVLVIQRSEAPRNLPAIIYLTDYSAAYEKMAQAWRKAGIREVWLWSPMTHLNYKAEADLFCFILGKHGIKVEPVVDEPQQLLEKIQQRKSKPPVAVAFLDTTYSETLCNREPHVIEQISRIARLAFCVGTVNIPSLQIREIRVDLVMQSPIEIASRVVEDISRISLLKDGVCHTFEAAYYEQSLLGKMTFHPSESLIPALGD